ncbi:hypothetical protein M569_16265, partial [Genlisea aurea]
MDGREGMTLQGSAAYYLSRGGGIGGSGGSGSLPPSSQPTRIIHQPTPGFKTPNNPFQTNMALGGGPSVSSSSSSFHRENPPPSSGFSHGVTAAMGSHGSEPVKKKRGRPRKYGPAGGGANMALGLSPLSACKPSAVVVGSREKGRRGRPPGTGWKQKLAPLGEWMNNSAGLAFTPHVLRAAIGEDVADKILAFAQQRPRALCIMSANGSVSAVTLRQPTNSGATVTYEGRFEILCLSGSYLVAENGGPRSRTGGISISVCSPDGLIIGGAIGGKLIAANPVQVDSTSFFF